MKNLFNLLITIGIITLIGTIGASDAGTIEMSGIFSQLTLSFYMMLFGFVGKYVFLPCLKILCKKYLAKKYPANKHQAYSYAKV